MELTDGMTDESYMRLAMEQAKEAAAHDEVPVGAVAVWDGKVIAVGRNRKEEKQNAISHAEIECLSAAAAVVGNWYLDRLTLYVTLEPCPMCAGAMVNARIARLVYGAFDPKAGAAGSKLNLLSGAGLNHTVPVVGGVLEKECAALLSDYFKTKRRTKC